VRSEIGCEEIPGIPYGAAIEQVISALKTEIAAEARSRLKRDTHEPER
jgi:hypothetical protein